MQEVRSENSQEMNSNRNVNENDPVLLENRMQYLLTPFATSILELEKLNS